MKGCVEEGTDWPEVPEPHDDVEDEVDTQELPTEVELLTKVELPELDHVDTTTCDEPIP